MGAGKMPRARAQYLTRGRIFAYQGEKTGTDKLWSQFVDAVLKENPLRHCGSGGGCKRVDADAIFLPLQRKCLHQADERHFGSAVIGLTEIAVEAR